MPDWTKRVAVLALCAAAACSSDSPSEPRQRPAVFRVRVAGVEEFALLLDDGARIAAAQRHLESGRVGVISGDLVASSGGFNVPYNWYLNPGTVDFPDFAIELCDGLPSHVENDLQYWLNTVKRYCPWSAQIVGRVS